MAIGTPTAPVAMASAAAATATTASFTPGADVALFALVTARKLSATIVTPTISDSLGLTWHSLDSVNDDPGSNPRLAAQLFVAFPGSSPSAMTVTGSSTGASQTGVTLVEVSGASLSSGDYTNVVHGAVNTAGDPSATLGSSPAASSGVLGFAFMNATNTITSPTGFTALQESTIGTAYRVESSYDITSPTAGAHNWTSTNTRSWAFLVEVPEPSAGGVDGNASGASLTETLSLSAGAANGDASASGLTGSLVLSLASGAASSSPSVSGAALAFTYALAGGAGSAGVSGNASGADFTLPVSFAAGAATGGASASGSNLPLALSLAPGAGSGASTAAGAAGVVTFSLAAGAASVSVSTAGSAFAYAYTLVGGTATAGGSATAPGATLSMSLSLVKGAVSGSASAAGANLNSSGSLQPGAASGAANCNGGVLVLGVTFGGGAASSNASASGASLGVILSGDFGGAFVTIDTDTPPDRVVRSFGRDRNSSSSRDRRVSSASRQRVA